MECAKYHFATANLKPNRKVLAFFSYWIQLHTAICSDFSPAHMLFIMRTSVVKKKLATPEEIYLDFSRVGQIKRLSEIMAAGKPPLISISNDIYFMQFSEVFKSQLRIWNMRSFRGKVLVKEKHVIIPQYPGGQSSLTEAMFAQTWVPNTQYEFRMHSASTGGGSSGAPLLQIEWGEKWVIGMHHGLWTGTGANVATPIKFITNVLSSLIHGTDPRPHFTISQLFGYSENSGIHAIFRIPNTYFRASLSSLSVSN